METNDPANRRKRILSAVLSASHGITVAEAARAVGLSVWRVGDVMRELRNQGLVEPTRSGGPGVRWTTPELARAIRAKRERTTRREFKTKQMAASRAAAKAEAARLEDEAIESWLYPRQVLIPALSADPLRPTGPTSVFNLAQV